MVVSQITRADRIRVAARAPASLLSSIDLVPARLTPALYAGFPGIGAMRPPAVWAGIRAEMQEELAA